LKVWRPGPKFYIIKKWSRRENAVVKNLRRPLCGRKPRSPGSFAGGAAWFSLGFSLLHSAKASTGAILLLTFLLKKSKKEILL
jgi:hypothetical protein